MKHPHLTLRSLLMKLVLIFGYLPLAVAQISAQAPKPGTIAVQVVKEKNSPHDLGRPIINANVSVPDGLDEQKKQKWKVVPGADEKGDYRRDWPAGVVKLSFDKMPFWLPAERDFNVIAGKQTPNEKTYEKIYLPPNVNSVKEVRLARAFFLSGNRVGAEESVNELVKICAAIQNSECDLVNLARMRLKDGRFEAAKQSIVQLASMLPTHPPFQFRAGQRIYLVAFRTRAIAAINDSTAKNRKGEYIDHALDLELQIRKKIERWKGFTVVDRVSDADFVFLVSRDGNSMEGLALPLEDYAEHFTNAFDLDALRDAAFGRYLTGPLKISTNGRLSDRLLRQFRKVLPEQ